MKATDDLPWEEDEDHEEIEEMVEVYRGKEIAASQAVNAMLRAGGSSVVQLMRMATKDRTLAKATFSEKELSFLTDAASRAKDFRDRLTDKQEKWARHILERPDSRELLMAAYLAEAAPEGDSAKTPISEPAKSPEPSVSYADDPSWGLF